MMPLDNLTRYTSYNISILILSSIIFGVYLIKPYQGL